MVAVLALATMLTAGWWQGRKVEAGEVSSVPRAPLADPTRLDEEGTFPLDQVAEASAPEDVEVAEVESPANPPEVEAELAAVPAVDDPQETVEAPSADGPLTADDEPPVETPEAGALEAAQAGTQPDAAPLEALAQTDSNAAGPESDPEGAGEEVPEDVPEGGEVSAMEASIGFVPVALPRETGEGEPCELHAAVRPGAPLRAVLGPCLGPWNADAQAVVGRFRHGGVPYCRHHVMLPRDLGGSIERARKVAAHAERQGLVPPLVQLRADRAGEAALRSEVESWIESGFENGSPTDHVLEALPGADHWRLRSWVRVLRAGDLSAKRKFVVELALDDGAEGDRLLGFRWEE